MNHAEQAFDYIAEAEVFGRYLLKQSPDAQTKERYAVAMARSVQPITSQDSKLLQFCVAHPGAIGAVDGGLALTQPTSEIRRRLYIMFAVLESSPLYAHYFLPQKRSWFYLAYCFWVGVHASARAVAGVVLLKALRV
jgi:hypothetical protein